MVNLKNKKILKNNFWKSRYSGWVVDRGGMGAKNGSKWYANRVKIVFLFVGDINISPTQK